MNVHIFIDACLYTHLFMYAYIVVIKACFDH